jgi:hypothetical protein
MTHSEKAKKQANTRYCSFQELLDTESNYRECLENVCTHFLMPTALAKFADTNFVKLFSNIEAIKQLSKCFSEALAPFVRSFSSTESPNASPSTRLACHANASTASDHVSPSLSAVTSLLDSSASESCSTPSHVPEPDWERIGQALLVFYRDGQFASQYKLFCADFTLVHERLEKLKTNQVDTTIYDFFYFSFSYFYFSFI